LKIKQRKRFRPDEEPHLPLKTLNQYLNYLELCNQSETKIRKSDLFCDNKVSTTAVKSSSESPIIFLSPSVSDTIASPVDLYEFKIPRPFCVGKTSNGFARNRLTTVKNKRPESCICHDPNNKLSDASDSSSFLTSNLMMNEIMVDTTADSSWAQIFDSGDRSLF
jgi:hypothetical protein